MNVNRSVAKLFSARVGSQFIGFIGLAYFARVFGAEEMGIFFLFQAVLSILALPADLGIREGIEKRISEGENPEKILTTSLTLKLVFSFILSVGLIVCRDLLNQYIGGQVTFLLVIALIINGLSEVAIRTLKGELRVGETASLQFARQAVWVGGGALFIGLGFGYTGIIYSLILGFSVVFIWGMNKSSTKFGSFSRKHAHSLWAYSKYSFIGAVGGSFYSWMDVAIIGLFLPQAHVGAYEMAWRIGVVVTLLSNTIAATIFPQVSEWNAQEDKNQIESLLENTITPSLFLVIPAFFGSLLLSKEILAILFGQDYALAWVVLIIFMAINFVQSIAGLFARTLRAINHPELVAKSRIVSMTINVILNFILINQFGIVGAAIATGVALSTYTLFITYNLSDYVEVAFPYQEVGWCVFAGAGMAIVVGSIQFLLKINTLPRLLGIVGFGAAVYLSLVAIYKPIRFKIIDNTRHIFAWF